ncbi:unnamed protein product [Diatraea saccharalis]|uniref:Uncharacterized protein n=1 Tax=Diatraea saccharalis TaxID=40085 RepID=A0A9N9WAI9_9NEOP|nr:unnamed protein product [Diatraea saccharalis]
MGWRAVHPPHIAAGLLLLLLVNLPVEHNINFKMSIKNTDRVIEIVLSVTCHQDHQDAVHITAILGESVVFNCQVDFPEDIPVPYVLQWEKKSSARPRDAPADCKVYLDVRCQAHTLLSRASGNSAAGRGTPSSRARIARLMCISASSNMPRITTAPVVHIDRSTLTPQ